MPFWEGLGFGLATALLIGPVFFTLLRASLDHGSRGGVSVAFGILVSDLLIAIICTTGTIALFRQSVKDEWIALASGIILVVLGVIYIVRPELNMDENVRLGRKNALGLMTSGFLVNFVNPFVFVIWIGFSLHASSAYGPGDDEWIFLGAILLGIFISDLTKALFAPKLRTLLSPVALKKVYRLIGIGMVLFSVRMFIHAALEWT